MNRLWQRHLLASALAVMMAGCMGNARFASPQTGSAGLPEETQAAPSFTDDERSRILAGANGAILKYFSADEQRNFISYTIRHLAVVAGDVDEFCVSLRYDYNQSRYAPDTSGSERENPDGTWTWEDCYLEIRIANLGGYEVVNAGTGGVAVGLVPLSQRIESSNPIEIPVGLTPVNQVTYADLLTTIDRFVPLDEIPELAGYMPPEIDEKALADGAASISAVAFDLNDDGNDDFILRLSGPLYGEAGQKIKALIHRADGLYDQLDLMEGPGTLGVLGTKTNGFFDLGSSSTQYHVVLRYEEGSGYQPDIPLPLYGDNLLGGNHTWRMEEGALYCDYGDISICGEPPSGISGPFYVGITLDPEISRWMADPILWMRDEAGNLVAVGPGQVVPSAVFSGFVLDEAETLSAMASVYGEKLGSPLDVVFAPIPAG